MRCVRAAVRRASAAVRRASAAVFVSRSRAGSRMRRGVDGAVGGPPPSGGIPAGARAVERWSCARAAVRRARAAVRRARTAIRSARAAVLRASAAVRRARAAVFVSRSSAGSRMRRGVDGAVGGPPLSGGIPAGAAGIPAGAAGCERSSCAGGVAAAAPIGSLLTSLDVCAATVGTVQ